MVLGFRVYGLRVRVFGYLHDFAAIELTFVLTSESRGKDFSR
jgi:hypothetical protein